MARITLPVEELATITRLALSAAITDDSAPVGIRSVKFTVGPGPQHLHHYEHRTFKPSPFVGDAITAVATDRYRMVWATAPMEPLPATTIADAFDFHIEAALLKRWLAWAPKRKSPRSAPPKVVVEVLEQAVTFTVGEDGWEQAVTLPRTDVGTFPPNFPNLRNVVTHGEAEQPDHWAVNPTYAAQMFTALSKACKWREPVAVSSGGANKPVRFSTVGPVKGEGIHASGLLMIVKDL